MTENIENIEKLLDSYKLIKPIPTEVIKKSNKTKQKRFKKIFKQTKGYSFLFSLIAFMFLTLRKAGFSVTVVQSAFVLALTGALITGSVVTGAYFTVDLIFSDKEHIQIEKKNVEKNSLINKKIKKKKVNSAMVIKNRIAVAPFTAENVSKELSIKVSDTIAEQLALIKGKKRIINYRFGRQQSEKMVLGSVMQLGTSYMINAKVVTIKDSKIIYYASETIQSKEMVNAACKRISKKIAAKIK